MSSHFPKSKSQNPSNGLKLFPMLTTSLLPSLFTIPWAHRQVLTIKVFCTCYSFWSSLPLDICKDCSFTFFRSVPNGTSFAQSSSLSEILPCQQSVCLSSTWFSYCRTHQQQSSPCSHVLYSFILFTVSLHLAITCPIL